MSTFSDVIILGGGPGGMAAAIWCERLSLSWRLFEKKARLGGQLSMIHTTIPDYPGMIYASGDDMRQALENHLQALDAQSIHTNTEIQSIQTSESHISISTGQEDVFQAKTLILASGVQRRRLRLPCVDRFAHKGISYTASGAIETFRNRPTAIIGAGDGALENAITLSQMCPEVHLIFRRDKPTARTHFVEEAKNRDNIYFYPKSTLHNITGEERIQSVHILSPQGIQTLNAEALLIKIGFEPSSHIQGLNIETTSAGHVVTVAAQQTTHPRIWSIGDVCSPTDPSLSLAVGQASVAVRDIERFLHKHKKIGIC